MARVIVVALALVSWLATDVATLRAQTPASADELLAITLAKLQR